MTPSRKAKTLRVVVHPPSDANKRQRSPETMGTDDPEDNPAKRGRTDGISHDAESTPSKTIENMQSGSSHDTKVTLGASMHGVALPIESQDVSMIGATVDSTSMKNLSSIDGGLSPPSESLSSASESQTAASDTSGNRATVAESTVAEKDCDQQDKPRTAFQPLLSKPRVAGMTFATIMGKTAVEKIKLGPEGPYLEDWDTLKISNLPEKCEVTDEDLQDEILRDGYASLPALRQGTFLSWKPSVVGKGHPVFSEFWGNAVPDMRIWNCLDALQFAHSGRYINPSRATPLMVNARRVSADGRNLRLYVGKSHAICVTSICSTDSYLTRVPPNGLPQKQLRGVVHSQEWERLVAFFCMVFFQAELRAQLYKDALAFTTKSGDRNFHGRAPPNESNMFKQSSNSKNTGERSMVIPTKRERPDGDRFVLNCDENVPVYDARHIDYDIGKNITNIGVDLKAFEGEIPASSFVVVGYTATCYHSNSDHCWHFSANIQWAVVMGVPPHL